mgnify:FL=1
MVCISEKSHNCDSVIFYPTDWENNADIITSADRVIVAKATDRENLKIYNTITKYFVVDGDIHLRLSQHMPGTLSFGNHRDIYTANVVMRTTLVKTAQKALEK